MYRHITTINGKYWAVTAPGIRPDDMANIQSAISPKSNDLQAKLNSCPDDGVFWTASFPRPTGYCFVTDLTGEHVERMYDRGLGYRPAFVPVDASGNYASHVLDDIPEGEVIPFCSVTMSVSGTSPGESLPQTNKHLAKFKDACHLWFHDITPDTKRKYIVHVVKIGGALVATRNIIARAPFMALYDMHLIQLDVKLGGRVVSWIDGEPWEIRVPAAYTTVAGNKNALILCDAQLKYLRELSSQRYSLDEYYILTSTKGSSPESVNIYQVGKAASFSAVSTSWRQKCAFLPDFIPLDPDTLEENPGYFDDSAFGDDSVAPEIRELGSLYVNGSAVNLRTPVPGHPFDRTERVEIGNTSCDENRRIQVIRQGDHFGAITPVLFNVSYEDLAELGLIQGGNENG